MLVLICKQTFTLFQEILISNICDLICEKRPTTVKHLSKQSFPHTIDIYRQIFIVTVGIQNCF